MLLLRESSNKKPAIANDAADSAACHQSLNYLRGLENLTNPAFMTFAAYAVVTTSLLHHILPESSVSCNNFVPERAQQVHGIHDVHGCLRGQLAGSLHESLQGL